MTLRKTMLLLAVFLFVTVPLALAQGTYTQFDVPGSVETEGTSINSAGDITGFYRDSNGALHGFLLSGGTYTTINYPGSYNTFLAGLNDLGQIVGASDSLYGFLYDVRTQTFTTINFPQSSAAYPEAINNAGTIAGVFFDGLSQYGFKLVGSNYKRVAPPGTDGVYITGLTAAGAVVGDIVNQGTQTYKLFLFDGHYKRFKIPNAPKAFVNGIDPLGSTPVGRYNPSFGVGAGFLYHNQVLTSLQFPGSSNTSANGINSAGEVVGDFTDADDKAHGFTWTPPAAAVK